MRWSRPLCVAAALAFLGLPAPASDNTARASCEAAANRFMAMHPHATLAEARKAGFYPLGKAPPPGAPQTYRDPQSGATFEVRKDGRHIAARNSQGRVLWVRDPFADSNLCPYRLAHPTISWIGRPAVGLGAAHAPRDDKASASIVMILNSQKSLLNRLHRTEVRKGSRFLALTFNSSQYGYVDIATGDYFNQGLH